MSFLQRPQRILCLWFPDWSVQRLIIQQPSLADSVVILTNKMKGGDYVDQCNELARRRGIRPGMPASEAQTFAKPNDTVVMQPITADQDQAALVELAVRCEPYSFCIGLEEAERPECLLMDVTGIAHFFTSEESLAEQLQRDLSQRRYQTRIAIANTVGMAWAVAHCLSTESPRAVLSADDRKLHDRLPIETLRIPEKILVKLQRLGIQTVGQLTKLERRSLWSRFGEDLLRRIDQLMGDRPEPITPCRPIPRFQVSRSLEHGIQQPAAIEQLWRSLLVRLVALLSPRQLGTRHLYGRFITEDRTVHEVDVRLCQSDADLEQLEELLRLQLERQRWSAPLIEVHMEALEVSPLQCHQQEIFTETSHDHAGQFQRLVNRLSSRLGQQCVTRPVQLANPIPELAIGLIPLTEKTIPAAEATQTLLPLDRPTALFPAPRPVEAIAVLPDGPPTVLFWRSTRFEVAHCWGPERIEFGWWLGPFVRRDYYRVATTDGHRLWVFRRLQDDRWFWHGEWC